MRGGTAGIFWNVEAALKNCHQQFVIDLEAVVLGVGERCDRDSEIAIGDLGLLTAAENETQGA